MEKLTIMPVKYGIGKYYTHVTNKGKRYPVIEMNSDLLDFDSEVFAWVLSHELDHYRYYSKPKNFGKKNSLLKEIIRLLCHPILTTKLAMFELAYSKTKIKAFSFNENDIEH